MKLLKLRKESLKKFRLVRDSNPDLCDTGLESCTSLNFFRLSFRNCKSCVYNAIIFFHIILHPKKVSSNLKTILKTDLANLRFLSFEKGETYQSILIIGMLRGKIARLS